MVAVNKDPFGLATDLMPGGVSSPVRAFKAVGGTPRFFVKGEGAFAARPASKSELWNYAPSTMSTSPRN